MAKWVNEAISRTDEKLEGISPYNRFLFRIEEFRKQIGRTAVFAKTCNECKNNKAAIDEIILKLDEAVKVPGNTRREYDRLLSHLSRHMMKEHKIFPPNYFRNLYSFFGLSAGLAAGFILYFSVSSLNWEMLASSMVIGSAIGYFTGIAKDKKGLENNITAD